MLKIENKNLPLKILFVSRFVDFISGPVHTKPEEFENGDFTLKTHKMFSVHTTPEKFKNAPITGTETLECTREHAHSKVLVEPTPGTHLANRFVVVIIIILSMIIIIFE